MHVLMPVVFSVSYERCYLSILNKLKKLTFYLKVDNDPRKVLFSNHLKSTNLQK